LNNQDLTIFDVDFALNQFSGNQALLIKILEKFTSQNENFRQELQTSLEQTELEAAKRQVHTLKGVTGNLGMKALHHACKDTEDKLEQLHNIEALSDFFQLFDATIIAAQNYGVAEEPKIEQVTPSPASAIRSDKEKLIEALQRNEFLSDAKLDQYINAIQLSAEDSEKLKKHIDDFNYANAIAILG
jgi:HPt (histidine-containing phosphotransfer) domain-containing protein